MVAVALIAKWRSWPQERQIPKGYGALF